MNRTCRSQALMWLAVLWIIPCAAVCAQDDRGSASRNIRQQALQDIPYDALTPEARERMVRTLQSASVFRRMPVNTIACDPDMYLFCVRYPEIVVDIWRLMGVSNMTAQRTDPYTLVTNDGAGTTSTIELVYGTPNIHIFLAKGRYTGSRLLQPLDGSCVMVLHTQYHLGATGEPLATSRLDVFLDIENTSAEWVARAVHPIFGGTADHNFIESLKFLEKLSQTTYENGPGIQGMAQKLTRVHPEVRNRFSQIAGMAFDRQIMSQSLYQPDAVETSGFQPYTSAGQ